MDYQEEQAGEIEAIASIYYGEFEVKATEPYHSFSIPIKSEDYEQNTPNGLSCTLTFTYVEKYPDVIPVIELTNVDNLLVEDQEKLIAHLHEEAQKNVGVVMIFTLVSTAQEWLNERWEEIRKEREECLMKKQQEEEEAERKRFEGTRVTVESFMRWKGNFEDEMGITKKKESIEKENKKSTGKEQFMTDKTLNESDLIFLKDGADAVKVDESLFQDMDDLELEDDEDYDPFLQCSDDESS